VDVDKSFCARNEYAAFDRFSLPISTHFLIHFLRVFRL